MTTRALNGWSRWWKIAVFLAGSTAIGSLRSEAMVSRVGAGTNRRTSEEPTHGIPSQASLAVSGSQQGADAELGKALFLGQKSFQKGGPACSTCHGIANLSVSHGPTPGADLTHEYSALGPVALNGVLTQPPFAPMDKIYKKSPLTSDERRELIAFLKREDEAKPAETLPLAAPPTPQKIAAGEAFFDGRVRMQNGGPACATCHTAAGIPFPFGGTMGPDLTREYSKLGRQGMAVALKSLYFPAMNPLFAKRPLTESEQSELTAFFESVTQKPPPLSPTVILLVTSIVLLVLFFLWTWLAVGQRRVRSVRRALLERAGAAKGNRR